MWNNLNDSFTALTGTINANISNLRQSIPAAFGDQENEEDKIKQLEIKIKLVQEEVFRHRDIALLYKDRWLTAQEALKSNGIQSKDYHDENDLLGKDETPKASQTPQPPPASASTSPTDLTALSEISLADEEEPTDTTASAGDHSDHHHRPTTAVSPPFLDDLALDSAAKEIQRLEDELMKANVDRDHWKTLAKQKSNAEEELDDARFQIVNYSTELKKCQIALEEALSAKSELEMELQELDAQHEMALAKVIKMRDEALEKLQAAVESSSQHDRGSSDGVTVQQRDSATIIDASTTNSSAVNDNAEGGRQDEQQSADVVDCSAAALSTLLSRLRSLAELHLRDDLRDDQPLSAVVDQIAARLSTQKDLEMRLELLTSSNRELEAKINSVQEEAKRKLKRQDDLLEEVELLNEQLTEEVEALKSSAACGGAGAGRQKSASLGAARPKSAEPSVHSTEELLQLKKETDTLKLTNQEYRHQVEQLTGQLKQIQAQLSEGAQALASKEVMISDQERMLRNLEEERDRLLEQLQAADAEHRQAVELKESAIATLSENSTELEKQLRKIQLEHEQQQKELDLALEQLKKREAELMQVIEAKDLKIEELEHRLEDVQSSSQSEAASLPEHREEPDGAEPESVEGGLRKKEVQAELEGLIAERDSLRQSLTAVEEEAAQLKTTNGRLEDHLKKVLEERSTLMKHLEELGHFQNEFGRLQSAYQQLVEQFEVLSLKHKQSTDEVLSLRADVASRASTEEKATEELVQLRDAVKRMSMLVQDKDQEVRELREKTAHFEAQGAMAELREGESERLKTELDRLRVHLVTVEDNYTAELMASEQKMAEMGAQVAKLQADAEEGAKLAEQLKTMKTARDKARNELSALEDRLQSYSTSIANLQAVIGQLEKDHERKVRSLEAEHQERLEAERAQTAGVVRKLQSQEERLRETLDALEAASRLSETIDAKEFTISQLKREVSLKSAEITALQLKIEDLKTSYEGKIDKQIVKSLLISFFATTHGTQARTEAERLLARFLDFNQQEMERAGIKIGRSAKANDSFTSMFVEFLESESKKEQGSRRKDSASGVSAPSGTAELAKDLNKRLAGAQTGVLLPSGASRLTTAMNPFVSHPSGPPPVSAQLGHHRTPSSASTGSSTSLEAHAPGNALFTGAAGAAASGVANIAQIVRDVVEKKEEDQFI